MENESVSRPSVIATLLWAFGAILIAFTVYSMFSWEGGLAKISLQDALLILASFSSGINAIATGALIDMHNMKRFRKIPIDQKPAQNV